MQKNIIVAVVMALIISLFNIPVYAKQSWRSFLEQMRQEAINQGISPSVVDNAFNGLNAPNQKVLSLDRTQPEHRITYIKYRNTRADSYRITLGIKELHKYQNTLSQVAKRYGVSECFIVSLWGLETSYGHYMGNFPVIYSLATLAYDDRRADLFRQELMLALHILNDGHVKLKDFHGEWAGASGQPQFLPSSWNDYAVDFDGDGYKDIWKSLPDSFASIANYLRKNGWRAGEPWAIPVTIPYNFNPNLLSLDISKPISQWQRMGIHASNGESFPDQDYQVSIIQPYGGPALMIFNNFKVIMKWNHSIYYAGTVGYMAEKICQMPLR